MLGVLRQPRLGRLVVAGLLSEVGDWLLMIALPLFVLDLTGSALVTASVFVLDWCPPSCSARSPVYSSTGTSDGG